jgi:hypothetical protein
LEGELFHGLGKVLGRGILPRDSQIYVLVESIIVLVRLIILRIPDDFADSNGYRLHIRFYDENSTEKGNFVNILAS